MAVNQRRGPTGWVTNVAGAVAVAGAGLLGAAGQAWAVAYTFTSVADSGGVYTSAGLGLGSINNDGTVAYVGTSADGTQRVLKTSMDGTTTVIADTSGPLMSFYLSDSIGTTPAINDQGVVGFVATRTDGTAIYTGSGGELRLVGETSTSPWRGSRPWLNASGQVLYGRDSLSGSGFDAVLDTNGSQVTIASTSSQYSAIGAFGINSAGQVLAYRGNSGSTNWFLSNGVSEEGIADGGVSSLTRGAISDYHAIFTGSTPGGGEAIYSYRNGVLSTLIDTGGPLRYFREIATNNHGDLVFTAVQDSGSGFIFSGTDLDNPIVSIGDPLLGSTITNLMMFPSLDDSGQFAFFAYLADYRQVLVRADVVPEPSTLCLLLGGFLAVALRRGPNLPR